MKKLFSTKGFTLIELLIVIAVLGVLAAAVVAAINPVQKINKAKDSTVKSDMGQLVNALQAYFTGAPSGTSVYPATLPILVSSQELKSTPKQQAGVVACTSINPAGSQGAGTEYCYGVSTTGDKAVIWGYIFDVAVSPSTTYYCWDSTNGVFRTSAAGATQPTSAGGYVCI